MTDQAPQKPSGGRRWLPGWRAIASIVSGLLLVPAFPAWDLGPLVWVWMLPLLAALWTPPQEGKKARPFRFGYLCGLAFFFPNLLWVRHSSRVTFGALDDAWMGWQVEGIGFAAAAALSGYLAFYTGLWAWFAGSVARPAKSKQEDQGRQNESVDSLRSAFLCAAAWVGCEWLRGWVMTGFGWNGLGVALHQNLALIQVADLVGVCGVSFLPVFVSCVVYQVMRRLIEGFQSGKRPAWHLDVLIAVLLVAGVFVYGQVRMKADPGPTTPLRVALVQLNIPLVEHRSGERALEMYQRYAELTRAYAEKRPDNTPADLVVWPESALPAPLYSHPDHPQYFNDILSLGDFSLLTGVDVIEPGGKAYNSAFLAHGNFDDGQLYHKVHLVVFGEYLPLRHTLPFMEPIFGSILPGDFDKGESTEPLRMVNKDVQIIPLICFEDTVGRLARRFVRDAPQLIVNITNDAWFLHSAETRQHLANARFRAIELRRPMCRAANTGVSCFIDPQGRIRSADVLADPDTGSTFIEGVLSREIAIPSHPPLTLYARWGDWFAFLMIGITALAGMNCLLRRWRGGAKNHLANPEPNR